MMQDEEEEKRLRSAALQNAQSILRARQRAEQSLERRTEELAHSLAMMRATLESTTDAIIVTDAVGRVTGSNRKYVEMWRIPPEIMDSGDHQRILEICSRWFDDPRRYLAQVEAIYVAAPLETADLLELTDGRVLERFSRTQFVDGRNVGRVWSFRDITERRRAEAEGARLLREVEAERARLADVFQHAPSFLCVLRGPDHILERANDRYFELLGRRDIIGQPVRQAIPELEGQGFFEVLDRVYRTDQPFVGTDTRITLRRGGHLEERILEFVYQPMRDAEGTVSGILIHGIDLTERKRAEAELRDSEARYRRVAAEAAQAAEANAKFRAFFEQGTNFAGVLALDGTVVECNRLCLDACGFRRDEVMGKPFWECGWWNRSAELREMVRSACFQAAGGRQFRTETRYFMADGTERVVDLILAPVMDEAGRVLFVAATGSDVTDRRRMEDTLREADRKKDDFLALLAHELRNPLAPLRSGLQVMRLADGDGKAVQKARAMMDRQLSHMVRLVDDLLDVSRISRNKMELRRARVLLADVLSSAVETARPLIEAAGHELLVALPEAPLHLDADLTRLAQVFSNLLTNSARYTEPGGRIWLSAERLAHAVVVSVRDTGIGIPAAALPTLFDMFSQVDRSMERTTGGLGIGLALVKGLVEMHGGTVAAESPGLGRGSTFTVTLPLLADLPVPRPTASDDRQTALGPRRRILVVDDNRDGADSLAMMLRLLNNEVQTVNDGVEALNAAERFQPEVILMDVGMPRLNGLDATRRIREQVWGRAVTIIALTGWGQVGDRERSREAGCDGHLVKPVNLPDLQLLLGELRRT
jgi:PAS domain S-box-containing protein